MGIKKNLFLSGLLCFSFHLASFQREETYSMAPLPAWVKEHEISLNPIPLKEEEIHVQWLHLDTQKNAIEGSSYQRVLVKPLTQTGVENISQIQVHFNPAFERVFFHKIRVLREGGVLDRLKSAKPKLIQRETNLENDVYNGSLSLIYFISDVREGDILEYSFSVQSNHPLFNTHFFDQFSFQRSFPVERMTYSLIVKPNFPLSIASDHLSIEPEVLDIGEDIRKISWEAFDVPSGIYESFEPSWYNPWRILRISQYTSWQEIVFSLAHYYTLPPDFEEQIPHSMKSLVEKWQERFQSPEERALCALRFVQDEIRYLGLEEGLSAWVPADPIDTFERRYGDCKDKSYLLHALLKLMKIDSIPILVHSYRGKALKNEPISPYAFNHLVLETQIGDQSYFVDPTMTLQGGNLKTNWFSNYEVGLKLDPLKGELMTFPSINLTRPLEITTHLILTEEGNMNVQITSSYYEGDADYMRRMLKKEGRSKLERNFLSYMQRISRHLKKQSIEMKDDRRNNIFTTVESYILPQDAVKTFSPISFLIRSYLEDRVDVSRLAPFVLSYPLWVRERIHIENPLENWSLFKDFVEYRHESFVFSQSIHKEGIFADFCLELLHVQDYVSSESLGSYVNMIDEIKQKAPL